MLFLLLKNKYKQNLEYIKYINPKQHDKIYEQANLKNKI